MEPKTQSSVIPAAIILGFFMIAVAIFFTNSSNNNLANVISGKDGGITETGEIRPVDSTDFIKGNPNAPILLIEYSDYDCPFCKDYHNTMNRVMDEFGVTGKIAWIYRQLPFGQLHPNSPKISEAALCVGDIGGNAAFWKFSDSIFRKRNLDEQTNITKLPTYAKEAGVDQDDFIKCIDEGKMMSSVEKSIEEAFRAGADSTPHTIIMVGNQQAVINGAQPYEVVRGIVQNLIEQLEGKVDLSEESINSKQIQ